jgi:hypothetical protein
MFVRGGLNFETGYFENQICELSLKWGGLGETPRFDFRKKPISSPPQICPVMH